MKIISPNRLASYKPSNNIFSYKRVLSLDNLKLFINNIKKSDLFSVYYDNVNDNFNIFIRTLLPLFKNSLTNNVNNPIVNYNTEWMTFGLLNSINTKSRLYKNYLKIQPLLNKKYTIYTKILKKVIRLAKQNYFNSKIKEYNNNQNKLWKFLNSLTNNSKVENNQYNITQINGIKITNKYKLADIFNNHFSSLDLNIFNNNNDPSKNNINNLKFILSNIPNLDNLDNYFNFNNVEINDILFRLKQINKSHSNHIYGLNYDCFKTKLYNTQYFVNSINMSFKEGFFRKFLKIVKLYLY